MAQTSYAVLVGNSEFPKETRLQPLRCPSHDVDGLMARLVSKNTGMFEESHVRVLKNSAHYEIQREINTVLKQADKDDFVLIYYSGHGQPDDAGRLHLATFDTYLNALESTAVPIEQVKRYIENGGSRRVALILDCCYSGAASNVFMKGGAIGEELKEVSEGRGTYILTASTAVQIAQEKDGEQYSVFTKHIIEGLGDFTADRDGDGYISMDDLYQYLYTHVREDSTQTPEKFAFKVQGDLFISRTGRLPREERKDRLRAFLFDLAHKGLISNAVLTYSLELIALKSTELSKQAKRYDDLLDELHQRRLDVGQFLDRWYRIESSSALTPAEAPVSTSRVIPPEIVSASRDPSRVVYALTRTLPKHPGGVTSGMFSPGGAYLASGAGDGQVRIWEVNTGELRHACKSQEGPVWSVSFAPNGSRIASCGSGRVVQIHDLGSGGVQTPASSSGALATVAYSADGNQLAYAGFDDKLTILAVHGETCLQIEAKQMAVNQITWSRDGRWLATGGNDNNIKIWEMPSGTLIKVLEGHRNPVYSLALSANGETLASGGRDGSVRLWDTTTWVQRAILRGHKHSVLAVAFHVSGKMMSSGGADGTIRFWSVERGENSRTVESGHVAVQFLAFSPNGQRLASGGADQTVRIWGLTQA